MSSPLNIDEKLSEKIMKLLAKTYPISDFDSFGGKHRDTADQLTTLFIELVRSELLPEPENFGTGHDDLVHLDDILTRLDKLGEK